MLSLSFSEISRAKITLNRALNDKKKKHLYSESAMRHLRFYIIPTRPFLFFVFDWLRPLHGTLQMPQINTDNFLVQQQRSVLITMLVILLTDHSEIASVPCLPSKEWNHERNNRLWSLELEVMTHHLTNPRGFINEGWITGKRVVALFNADNATVTKKGGLSPAQASCIRATGACRDPWIHSPSFKTNVTANLASLLFSFSPQS